MKQKKVIELMMKHYELEIEFYERLSKQAREDAISSEIKQEGKYDTRAIEAGYLAGAQKRRYDELVVQVQTLKSFVFPKKIPNKVVVGSLVTLLESEGEIAENYFLSPVGGGFEVLLDSERVKVISLESALARALIRLEEGEQEVSVQTPKGKKEYQVIEIC